MSKKNIISNLTSTITNQATCDDFKNMHECLESYFKEILLIGLRKKGGKYKDASRAIRHSFIKMNSNTFNRAMQLIEMPDSWNDMKKKNSKLAELENLVLNYSCHVRNILVHGGYYPRNGS